MSLQRIVLCAGIAALTLGCGEQRGESIETGQGCFIERDEIVQDFTTTPEGFAYAPSELVDMAEGTFDGEPIANVNGDVIVGSSTRLEMTVTSMRALVESEGNGLSISAQTAGNGRTCYGPHYITNLDIFLSTPDGELDEQMSTEVQILSQQEFRGTGRTEVAGTLRPLRFAEVDWDELAIDYELSHRQDPLHPAVS